MAGCTVGVLGGFRVTVDDRTIPDGSWRHKRGSDLVKLLAISPAHRLHREQVIDALWPDLAPESGGANLRKAVHFARRALGSDLAIGTDGPTVSLWPDGDLSVDLDAFETAASAAAGSRDASVLDATLALYGGALLPDDLYSDWTHAVRDRVRLAYLRLLRTAGRWERLLEADPADEEAHRRLMSEHLEAGNRHAAIRQFERLRDALRDELGVSPDQASIELYEQVLAMDGHQPPTPQERARALLAWGLVHWNRRDLTEAAKTAEEARSFAIDAGLDRELGEASALLGLVAHAQGRWRARFRREFIESMDQKPELASAVFDAHLCFAEFSLYGPEGLDDAEPFARELLSVATAAASIPGRGLATLMLGEVALLSGRLDDAERELSEAVRLNEAADRDSAVALSLERHAELAIAKGQRVRAGRSLARAARVAERSALVSHIRVRVLGAKILAAGDPARALGVVKAAEPILAGGEVCEPCSMTFRVAAATAAARAGDRERAARYVEDAERLAGMWQGGPWLAAVWEARGELRLADGEPAQAAALFREAADGFAQAGRKLDEARCREAATAG